MDFDGVVEGVALNEDYRVQDQAPATRVTSDEKLIIIIAEEDGVDLRVVTVTLPEFAAFPLGQEVVIGAKGSGAPYLKASVGELDDFTRNDGVHVLNSKNTRFSEALQGTLFLDEENGELIGSFSADMEDGGHLEGSFIVASN